jgi:hypothetical protein
MKPRFANIEDTRIAHLFGTGEGNDAAQIGFCSIFSVREFKAIQDVLEIPHPEPP